MFNRRMTDRGPPPFDLQAAELRAIRRSQAVIEFAPDGTILDANANFLGVMGYAADEVVGRHHSMFVDPAEARGTEYAEFWARLRNGEFFQAEYRRFARGQREVWIQGSYNPVLGPDGVPIKIVKFATEITASKIRSADHAGQIAAIGTTQAVITFAMDGTIQSANDLFCDAVGYDEDEIVGRHHAMFVLPDERDGDAYRAFWRALNAGQCQSGEFRRIGRDGRSLWLQAAYTPIFDPAGRPFKVVKYASVITDRVQQQQRFNLLSLVADGTDNSVVITDRDKRIIYVNQGFERLTGRTQAEVRGKNPGHFLQGRHTDQGTVARIRSHLDAGQPFYEEILNYTKAGEPYWISLAINPVRDAQGGIEKYISIQANITATKMRSVGYDAKLTAISASTGMSMARACG